MTVRVDTPPTSGDHVVKFYDHEPDLAQVASGYMAAGLDLAEPVLVFAFPSHEAMFRTSMLDSGVDVPSHESEGRLVFDDAVEVAAALLSETAIDAGRFDQLIARPVRNAFERFGSVRVYGEIVNVLWEQGKVAAAIDLEERWNSLADEVPFGLFCSYPSQLSDSDDAFHQICALHSGVAPRMPDSRGEISRYFQGIGVGPRLARQFVAGVLESHGGAKLLDEVTLIVSELATNAVTHASSDFIVGLSFFGNVVRIDVLDGDPTPPLIQHDEANPLGGGRGLRVVDELADHWGHELVADGKSVWAEIG